MLNRGLWRSAIVVVALGGACDPASAADAAQEPAADEEAPPATQVVRSPDGTIEASIIVSGHLTYEVQIDGQRIVEPSQLGLKLRSGTTLGQNVELVNATHQTVDTTWQNDFGKRRDVRNYYNQLHLLLRERSAGGITFELVFRVFDDGVAFRYELLSQPALREFVLEQELSGFVFPGDFTCYAGEQEKGFSGPQEWEFSRRRLSDIKDASIIGLPVLVETPAAWVAIAEADLLDWAGMWLGGVEPKRETASASDAATVALRAKLAPRPDGEGLVKASAPHRSPWRVLMIGRQPGKLIESEIVRNLGTASEINDASWVKPGMMAWDHWWTGDSVMDTATVRQYIELAADMGWPYQLIDCGWYGESNRPEADITKVVDSLDMAGIRRFAEDKGVRLWLWLHWTDVDRNDAYKKAFPLYKEWGIAGVKIDFMDRDDQEMVRWYEKITRAAADHQLMVNFHGAFKPSGFDRTFPNQLTREGVLGNEYNKWSNRVTPEHKVTLPFTRYLVGPGDFTPGGFLNRQPARFEPTKPTQVQGTRAAELALFVVYESPLACVCDYPDHYRNQLATSAAAEWRPGADFLKVVPTTWDDTRVLGGVVGEHLVIARQSGSDWFVGALTNSQAREVDVDFSFLGPGSWKMTAWKDGADAADNAEHLTREEKTVRSGDSCRWHLAPAGGCVAWLQRQ
jgi:alpha-glucosidase